MQKLKALLSTIAIASTFAAMPAHAQTFGGSYGTDGENGGCSAARYHEETYSPYRIYFWDVPDLANGESVTLGAGVMWFDPYTGQLYTSGPGDMSFSLTFSCSEGVISGGANFGYWGPA